MPSVGRAFRREMRAKTRMMPIPSTISPAAWPLSCPLFSGRMSATVLARYGVCALVRPWTVPLPGVLDEGPIVGNKPDGFCPVMLFGTPFPPVVPGSVKLPVPSGELLPMDDDPDPLFPVEPPVCPCPCPPDDVLVAVGVGVGVGDVGGAETTSAVALPVIEPVVVAPGAAAVTVAASVAVSPDGAELGTTICAWS